MTQFLDLIQTSGVTWPVFVLWVMVFIVAVGIVIWALKFWPDDSDEHLATTRRIQEAARNHRIQEAKLMAVAAEPAERMETLSRGAGRPVSHENGNQQGLPFQLIDLALHHGFEARWHGSKNELILFDIEIRDLEVSQRVFTYPLDEVIASTPAQHYQLLRRVRKLVNKRAKAAGYTPIKRKAGRPVRSQGVIT